ncbi:MAG: CvpA family protein [Erythrobacter sp.]
MVGLDIIIAVIVGLAAIVGFMRGLVREVLSLALLIVAAFALHFLHLTLTDGLRNFYYTEPGVSLLTALALLLIPFAALKAMIGNPGSASEGRFVEAIDRVIGFGVGGVKGALLAVFGFALLVTGFDGKWGYDGRPQWITDARTYAGADAFSRKLLPEIAMRQERLRLEAKERAAVKARLGK